jgi:hypothetical protein
LHVPSEYEALDADIRAFLKGPVVVKLKGDNIWNSDWYYCDANGVVVNVYLKNEFGSSAIQLAQTGQRTLYNSNPVIAHSNCSFARFKAYHFIRGQLYKCGPVALLPEFDTQHPLLLTESDKELLNSYRPLTMDNFDSYHKEFFDNIDNPIPQCKFCPEQFNAKTIFPIRKGSKQ